MCGKAVCACVRGLCLDVIVLLCLPVRLFVCLCSQQVLFAYKSWTDGMILMILTYIIDIDETLKFTQSQGHKVKGQSQICNYVKNILGYK